MSLFKVTNPTTKAKAVRIAGGHSIVDAGKSKEMDLDLTDDEGLRYVAAGLKFKPLSDDENTTPKSVKGDAGVTPTQNTKAAAPTPPTPSAK